jgi:hypothetical protein
VRPGHRRVAATTGGCADDADEAEWLTAPGWPIP